ncbi:MAG: hypothetical protein Kow0080_08140 [Candidatus Promineifilaceae bacterium]
MNSHHMMELLQIYPTGVEEWQCPACQRHFVLRTEPSFKRIILNEGDLSATHSGTKGNVAISHYDALQHDDSDISPELRDALEAFFNDLMDGDDGL